MKFDKSHIALYLLLLVKIGTNYAKPTSSITKGRLKKNISKSDRTFYCLRLDVCNTPVKAT